MLKTTLTTVTILFALVSGGAAQQAQPVLPQAKPEPASPQTAARAPAQLVNIKIELSITDQRGESTAVPKLVTIIVADRESGRIRTLRGNNSLNVDARPDIPREGRVRVVMTLEYKPVMADGERAEMMINETLTALLEDGKSMVVSQAVDPTSDRRVRVEMKATVMR